MSPALGQTTRTKKLPNGTNKDKTELNEMSKHSGPLMEKLCRAIGSTKKNWLYGKNPHLYEV